MLEPEETRSDPPPFVELIVKHERQLMRYIRTLLPKLDDAEEVWQATAVVLWEKFDEYDPERDFIPWAQRFAYFETLRFRRRMARDRMVFSENVMQTLAETHESSREKLEARSAALRKCLEQLIPRDQALLRARYETDTTINDLAQTLNTTAKTLYRRLDRIRERLGQCVRRRVMLSDE